MPGQTQHSEKDLITTKKEEIVAIFQELINKPESYPLIREKKAYPHLKDILKVLQPMHESNSALGSTNTYRIPGIGSLQITWPESMHEGYNDTNLISSFERYKKKLINHLTSENYEQHVQAANALKELCQCKNDDPNLSDKLTNFSTKNADLKLPSAIDTGKIIKKILVTLVIGSAVAGLIAAAVIIGPWVLGIAAIALPFFIVPCKQKPSYNTSITLFPSVPKTKSTVSDPLLTAGCTSNC